MKVADSIKTVISLQMNDKFQYADVMRLPRVDILPEANIHGRGLAKVGERILEFQTALARLPCHASRILKHWLAIFSMRW